MIENMFGKLKRLATYYDQCAHTLMPVIQIAATFGFHLKECVLSLSNILIRPAPIR